MRTYAKVDKTCAKLALEAFKDKYMAQNHLRLKRFEQFFTKTVAYVVAYAIAKSFHQRFAKRY